MAVLTEEQTMLKDQAHAWARDESPVTSFRQLRDSGSSQGFDPGTWTDIAGMGWTPNLEDGTSDVWMLRLNRDQNHVDLLYGDPETGGLSQVLEEENESYIEVETGFSDLSTGTITYLQDGRHFVWLSDTSHGRAFQHIRSEEIVRLHPYLQRSGNRPRTVAIADDCSSSVSSTGPKTKLPSESSPSGEEGANEAKRGGKRSSPYVC